MMIRTFCLALVLAGAAHAQTVGVTLLPYYSWTASIVEGTPVKVVPVMGENADPHAYQGSPADVKRLGTLDALVINGLGHDDFIQPMIKAANNPKLLVVQPSSAVALISYAGGGGSNPHTFIALTSAVQQILVIEQALARLAPAHAARFRANTAAYTRKLRSLKSATVAQLAKLGGRRIATVHDGYAYLLNELGLSQVAVIEPTHGAQPSAGELARTIGQIRRADVKIVLSEISFPEKLVEVVRKETGARVYTVDHMSGGAFTRDSFEKAMEANLATIVRAFQETR